MTNKELIQKKLDNLEIQLGCKYTIGCYNKQIERIPKCELMKVINNLTESWIDVDVSINGKEYVVEIATVDSERDLNLISKAEYISKYKNERYRED